MTICSFDMLFIIALAGWEGFKLQMEFWSMHSQKKIIFLFVKLFMNLCESYIIFHNIYSNPWTFFYSSKNYLAGAGYAQLLEYFTLYWWIRSSYHLKEYLFNHTLICKEYHWDDVWNACSLLCHFKNTTSIPLRNIVKAIEILLKLPRLKKKN